MRFILLLLLSLTARLTMAQVRQDILLTTRLEIQQRRPRQRRRARLR